ncbi:hypothetical protein BO79DRAFT_257444 [Aspergillus costaricaensis CBS 115574]|uniref:Uncharacterized protein n=1 Tax=Aspergillus costaricaensis CBS 115574 TaxID=1448317 RepID=A0ACD1I7M1_9EURO|nr:hypothetical protein BO79DRAFT_257444 [Aspergillus costaricaensis CBS 115574]RAK86275.1 hypothetical protein BO79DRAFT_257444 [Aspergillus costaricaensis CBS 115574]
MSSGSTFRNHCVQIASLLRAQISESTPTTIYNALQELQSNRDKLAAATGTAGSDLSLSDIIKQAVSDLNERNSLISENQRLKDECITLRTLCRGLQETNGDLEGDVNRLQREHTTVNDNLAGALGLGESRPEFLLPIKSITDELQSWKIHAKETAKRAEQKQKEAEKQIAKAREDKGLAKKAQNFYDKLKVAVSLKGEFDLIWKDIRKHCDRYIGYKGMDGSNKQMAIHAIWEYLCRNAWRDDKPLRHSNSSTRGRFFGKKSNPLESLFPKDYMYKGRPMSEALDELVDWAQDLQTELESYGFRAHIDPVGQLDEGLPLSIDSGVMICVKHRKDGCLGFW